MNLPKFETTYNLTNEEATRRVKLICDLKDYVFISFCDKDGNNCDYKNNQTHLKLFCKKCQQEWYSTTYNRFMCNVNCPNCKKVSQNKALNEIDMICKQNNYSFLGFCDKNGNDINWKNVTQTYLKIKCNNCNSIWTTCSYDNFIHGRRCPNCRSRLKNNKYKYLIDKCEKNNWTILGFFNINNCQCEWSECVKIKLLCNKCQNIWFKNVNTIYSKTICPKCATLKNGENHIKNKQECLEQILDLCKKRNYKFHGFCDKQGEMVEWYGSSTYLFLECLNCGHIWKTCTYYNFTHHLRGCPKCKQSHLEFHIETFLKENNIKYQYQQYFDWLGYLSLDFYLPQYNVAIECQGKQHFGQGGWTNDKIQLEKVYQETQERDNRKRKLCEEHGIKLLYYSNLGIEYPYKVYEDKNELIQEILGSTKTS